MAVYVKCIEQQTYLTWCRATLTAWCEHHNIPYQGVPVGTIKKHATGKGNASKDEMIASVRELGHAPIDDNEADALALLHWALEHGGAR
ncbi:hypothetical protein SAMN05421863_106912 [Nitrosomonas communis]|uniref:Uncharacterized protein n=1 Tax=Nitrosomonas communis TaxID=44574 RepID=A0A1I4URU5_9PROT|nr:hypothetical protein SAMN05421863_106912 [Nitrosomonas communis]